MARWAAEGVALRLHVVDVRAEQGRAGYEYVKRIHSPEAVLPVLTEFLRGVLAGR